MMRAETERTQPALFRGSNALEVFNGCVGLFQAFDPTNRFDELLELAVITLDHIVQIFHLMVFRPVRQLTLFLRLPDRYAIARSLVRVNGLV